LTDDRPIQICEENLFRYFADKNVPLVFVLTKYDRLVTTFIAEIFQTTGRMTAIEWREADSAPNRQAVTIPKMA
jgi:GTP-binding protein EngB required for normal cell division